MRLLQCTRDSGFRLTPDMDEDEIAVHPYAILSHTWGAEGEEVTFEDLASGAGERKPGYKKIKFCGKQAEQDGLQYFWIDTCCINKGNKAEFSQAIQSMFRWYRNAARCYVYLSDVSCAPHRSEQEANMLLWDLEFRQSKWFKRGWTLQELLAPSLVEFFSCQGKKLGDKISLKQQIHEITSIPSLALEGTPLSQFSISERLRWKGDRETTRDEDRWYSLSGIFYVEIAPAYSEGAASAFRRLKEEIDKQERCVQDVRHTDPRDDKKRIEDAKGGLLADSYRWVLNNTTFQQWQQDPHNQLLWINGDPGKGKTMLLCGIIDELHSSMPRTALLSYFFCQETDSRINSATAVLRGILYMLVSQQPSLVSHVRKKYDHAGKTLFEDANAWVALTEIFSDVLRDPNLNTTYLIIDALDECVTNRPKLLEFIAMQSSTSQRVKWIVSSRNWPDIETQLERAGHKVRLSLELNAKSVAAAVDTFIQRKVDQLAKEKRYKAEMRHAVLQHLTSNANDTFLWVALVCQDLRATPKWNVLKKLPLFPPGLDSLYKRMMHQIDESDGAEVCRQVLASVAILYRPVTIPELIALVEQLEDFIDDLESVREIISLCGSFLTLREDTVYFVHQSAKDFLINTAPQEPRLFRAQNVHNSIFSRSLQLMSMTLRRDIYNLRAPGISIDQVEPPDPDPLAAIRYSCLYWVDHLLGSRITKDSVKNLEVSSSVYNFLHQYFLYWLEALSLLKSVSEGVVMIRKLANLQLDRSPDLRAFIQDATRFAISTRSVIEQAPLQAYCSALVFAPEKSIVRTTFQKFIPSWIQRKPGVETHWNAMLQTLEGHSGYVMSVAFSPDGKQVVSGSDDTTVRLWDAATGALQQTLEGHSDYIRSVAFSPDGKQVVSGSDDTTVRLWDTATGALQQTLEGHSDYIRSVAFSPDGKQVVSGSNDKTVRLWDTATGALQQTLEGHSDYVMSVAFSPDGKQVVSGSNDKTVRLWDAATGALQQSLEGHSDYVRSVAFSPDGKQVVSGSNDKTVRFWDAATGALQQSLEGHSDYVRSVAFSPDGKQVVSGSNDKTVRLWDTATGALQQTLEGHSDYVMSVAFSPDGKQVVSGSKDLRVRLWDAATGALQQTLEGHSSLVTSVTFSPDGKHIPTLHVTGEWLVEGTARYLWLPTNYRPICEAVWGRIVVLGHSSGRLSFLEIRPGLNQLI